MTQAHELARKPSFPPRGSAARLRSFPWRVRWLYRPPLDSFGAVPPMSPLFPLPMPRRHLLAGLLAVVAALPALAAQAVAFPAEKPVRLVVPYPPGGTADILARALSDKLAAELNQNVVVENRAGAGTAIGARYVASAPGDGYTLFIGTSTSHAINPALQPHIGYHPVRDFTPIAAVGEVPYVIVSHPTRGWKTLDALVARSRAEPGRLTYASAGIGSSNHLGGELLSSVAQLSLTHVPYKGSAPALNDVLSGQVDFMFDLVTTAQAHVRGGRLDALATTAARRTPLLPQVPTAAEAGVPGLNVTAWFGLFASPGLPAAVRDRLVQASQRVLSQPDTRQRLEALGISQLDQRGPAFQQFVEQDYRHWQGLVARSNIRMD